MVKACPTKCGRERGSQTAVKNFTIKADREIHHQNQTLKYSKRRQAETVIVDIVVPGEVMFFRRK